MAISYPQATDDAVFDFVRAVYPKLIKKDFALLCQTYTDYVVAKWFSGDVKQMTGSQASWNVVYRKGTSAKHSRMGEKDTVSIQNVSKRGHAQWCHFGFNYSWLRQELLMVQNDPDALIDLLGSRRASEQVGALDDLEAKGWGAPTDSTDAEEIPMGIPFWVQKKLTGGTYPTGGFEGGDPSGFTGGAGGLDVSSYPNAQNYTAVFSAWTDEDCIDKLQRAMFKMKYKRPAILNKDIKAEDYSKTKLFVGLDTKLQILNIAKSNQDSLGWDLGVGADEMRFYRHTLDYAPILDSDTDYPIYLLDMNTIFPIVLKGDKFHETEVRNSQSHDYFTIHNDLTYQYVCSNRRHNGVICKV